LLLRSLRLRRLKKLETGACISNDLMRASLLVDRKRKKQFDSVRTASFVAEEDLPVNADR
jgi:hypothetical protein